MKNRSTVNTILVLGSMVATVAVSAAHFEQRVAYIGGSDDRASEYKAFLESNFKSVTLHDRATFKPEDANSADVVLLDWPQGNGPFPPTKCPLGERSEWAKPTVLLGSAGLNVAVSWKLVGGSG